MGSSALRQGAYYAVRSAESLALAAGRHEDFVCVANRLQYFDFEPEPVVSLLGLALQVSPLLAIF